MRGTSLAGGISTTSDITTGGFAGGSTGGCSMCIGWSAISNCKGTDGGDCTREADEEASTVSLWVGKIFPETTDKGGIINWSFLSGSSHASTPGGRGCGTGFQPFCTEASGQRFSATDGCGCRLWNDGGLKELTGVGCGGPRVNCPVLEKYANCSEFVSK